MTLARTSRESEHSGRSGWIVGELVVGTVTGFGGMVGGALIGFTPCMPRGGYGSECIAGAFIGALGGTILGASLGTYAVGAFSDGHGGFGYTLLGAAGGTLAMLGVGILFSMAGPVGLALVYASFLLPAAGAVLAYEASGKAGRLAAAADRRRPRVSRAAPRVVPTAIALRGGAAVGVAAAF